MSGRISVAAAIAPAEFFKAQSALQSKPGHSPISAGFPPASRDQLVQPGLATISGVAMNDAALRRLVD